VSPRTRAGSSIVLATSDPQRVSATGQSPVSRPRSHSEAQSRVLKALGGNRRRSRALETSEVDRVLREMTPDEEDAPFSCSPKRNLHRTDSFQVDLTAEEQEEARARVLAGEAVASEADTLIHPHPNWNLELGTPGIRRVEELCHEFSENDHYYFNIHFVRQPDPRVDNPKYKLGPGDFVTTVVIFAKDEQDFNVIAVVQRKPDTSGGYRGHLWTKQNDREFWFSVDHVKSVEKSLRRRTKSLRASLVNESLTADALVHQFKLKHPEFSSVRRVRDPNCPTMLLNLELVLKIQAYKFAVVFSRAGQRGEDALDNRLEDLPEASQDRFLNFLDLLGKRVRLLGWQGYRGDLDVRTDITGTHSIYTEWNDRPVMFQVLPWISESHSRRSKTGNDINVIVYQESGSFQPPLIPSTVIHNYFVVRPVDLPQEGGGSSPGYRFGVAAHKGFSRYRPVIPEGATFLHGEGFRHFLFYKLINGERAAHFCEKKVSSAQHSLLQHRLATRQGQIDFIVNNCVEPKETGSRIGGILRG